jgi:hypothetical protein
MRLALTPLTHRRNGVPMVSAKLPNSREEGMSFF